MLQYTVCLGDLLNINMHSIVRAIKTTQSQWERGILKLCPILFIQCSIHYPHLVLSKASNSAHG